MSSDGIVRYSVFVVKNAFIDTISNKCNKNLVKAVSIDFDKKARAVIVALLDKYAALARSQFTNP
ncbi:hypothetical protein [Dolichospermum sp. UHCC 0259]|uniref:hypothetical protein n=1 Tax=Dolichospermum sp. UHCC 0259 TaxID=2590010 RepID=UPI00144625EF|nr:hypothetical protein [Dolichospermum sp. UHCC 0259]MTJ50896.1 hypothetical protein [Dolichospermum sp. UHCC 0259]